VRRWAHLHHENLHRERQRDRINKIAFAVRFHGIDKFVGEGLDLPFHGLHRSGTKQRIDQRPIALMLGRIELNRDEHLASQIRPIRNAGMSGAAEGLPVPERVVHGLAADNHPVAAVIRRPEYVGIVADASRRCAASPLRIHLQNMGNRARQVYNQSAPSNAGTKQLGLAWVERGVIFGRSRSVRPGHSISVDPAMNKHPAQQQLLPGWRLSHVARSSEWRHLSLPAPATPDRSGS